MQNGISYSKLLCKMELTIPNYCVKDYPTAKAYFIYGGERQMSEGAIDILPMEYALKNLLNYFIIDFFCYISFVRPVQSAPYIISHGSSENL